NGCSDDVAEPKDPLYAQIANLVPAARVDEALRSAHGGEVAPVAGGGLLDERAFRDRVDEAAQQLLELGSSHPLGVEAHLPAAVDEVEERLHDGLAGEDPRRREDVERDLELPAAAEEPAVVARGAARLVVAQD